MPREATLPPRVVNVPGDYFSMAGFEVTLYGRFWVTPEVKSLTWLLLRLSVSFFNERHLDKEVSPAIELDELAAVSESSSIESEESQVKCSRLSGSVISSFFNWCWKSYSSAG